MTTDEFKEILKLQDTVSLAEKLDEPKKVIIPQFVDDWIEEAKADLGNEVNPLGIIFYIGNYVDSTESHYEWLNDIDNQKLLLNAITNGYDVEKEIVQYVKFKGLDESTRYLNYDVTFEKFYVDTTRPDSDTKIKFTKSWLKDNWSEYEAYNNAGLLEFEEVEDD